MVNTYTARFMFPFGGIFGRSLVKYEVNRSLNIALWSQYAQYKTTNKETKDVVRKWFVYIIILYIYIIGMYIKMFVFWLNINGKPFKYSYN